MLTLTNENRKLGDVVVERYNIISTPWWDYVAREPSKMWSGPHSDLATIDGICYGDVASRRLPHELDALPACTDERSIAVRAWQSAQYEHAYELIIAAFPEAANGHRDMGRITVVANRPRYYRSR